MTAQTAIVIYNARLGADRRQIFLPTCISAASYMAAKSSAQTGGMRSGGSSYKLRISVTADQDGKTYVSEAAYKAMSDEEAAKHWTIQRGDQVLTCEPEDKPTAALSAQELTALATSLCCDLISVTEYADNTIRGTAATKHWRIGGA